MIATNTKDKDIEKLWDELEDVPFDVGDDGKLILAEKWNYFKKGTYREDIWSWFDKRHSKGIGWLMNVYETISRPA